MRVFESDGLELSKMLE